MYVTKLLKSKYLNLRGIHTHSTPLDIYFLIDFSQQYKHLSNYSRTPQ